MEPYPDHTSINDGILDAQAVGVVVTASHNPEEDNGIKLTDTSGGMLDAAWESRASELANCDNAGVLSLLSQWTDGTPSLAPGEGTRVVVGRDTRATSPWLSSLVCQGVRCFDVPVVDLGEVPTPVVHFAVGSGEPTSEAYVEHMATAFGEFWRAVAPQGSNRIMSITVDAAGGVGAVSMDRIARAIPVAEVAFRLVNGPGDEGVELNARCGAEHVQKQREPPCNMPAVSSGDWCSLDGDADRIVFHSANADGEWTLLDGDALAVLWTDFLATQFRAAGWTLVDPESAGSGTEPEPRGAKTVSLGVVQTAYANGGSTEYLQRVARVPVALAKTGVKHVHHRAEDFDVGVYFEANGHGTALVREEIRRQLQAQLEDSDDDAQAKKTAVRRLLCFDRLVNQFIGDAVSDLLVTVAILHGRNMRFRDWRAMYHDRPSRQTKLPVADRTAISTNVDETKVLQPESLQAAIDDAVREVDAAQGRAFARCVQ